MRVYEIAKEAGVTSAEVLKAAESAGIAAATAISSLEAESVDKLRAALKGVDGAAAAVRRREKLARAAELNAKFFAEQRERLAVHLRVAKAAAEGASKPVAARAAEAEAAVAAEVKAEPPKAPALPGAEASAPAKPAIRMAPGFKPKPLPSVSAAQTGLTAASGFKPLQHA